MKTIIKKSGQKFNITDSLYKSIIKNGIMEDANPTNAGQDQGTPQNNESDDKAIITLYIKNDPKAMDELQKHPQIIDDIKAMKAKDPNESLATIVANYKQSFNSQLQGKSNQGESNLDKKIDFNNSLVGMLKDKIEKDYVDKILNKLFSSNSHSQSPLKKFNEYTKLQVKSMIGDNQKVNINDIDIVKSLFNDFFSKEDVSKLSEDIAKYIFQNNDEIIKKSYVIKSFGNNANFGSAEYYKIFRFSSLQDFVNPMAKENGNKDENYRKFSGITDEMYSRIIYLKIYEYVHKRITDKNFIENTIQRSKYLPADWIKNTFIPNLDIFLRNVILNKDPGSNAYNKNAINIFKYSTSEEVNKIWDEVKDEILNEKELNYLDESILYFYKTTINDIDRVESETKEKGNSDNEMKTVALGKKKLYDSYNAYRTNLYDKVVDMVENVKLDKKMMETILSNFNTNKENILKLISDTTIKNCLEICKELGLDEYNYNKKVKENNKNKKTTNESVLSDVINRNKKGNNSDINVIELFNILSEVSASFYNKLSEYTEKIKSFNLEAKSGKDISSEINDFNRYVENKNFKDVYVYSFILTKILENFDDYLKSNTKLDMDKYLGKSNKDQHLKRFYELMGRYPDTSDIESYRNIVKQIKSSYDIMKSIRDELCREVQRAGYSLSTTIIVSQMKDISWRVLNNLLGSDSLTKSADYIVKCLAYSELTKIVNEKKDENSTEYKISKEIIGDSGGIEEKDFAKLFYMVININKNLSTNILLSMMEGNKSVKGNVKFVRTFMANRLYTAQPVAVLDESTGSFIGCITFVKYSSLREIMGGVGSFFDAIKSVVKSHGSSSRSKNWMG